MTTETVHPMVMKAAIGLRDHIAPQIDKNPAEFWDKESQSLIAAAQAALTECGALECFDSAVSLLSIEDAGEKECDDAALLMMHQQNAVASARLGVAKARGVSSAERVYGSAPE